MKILVVEDDLTIQKQLKNLLSGNGYEVDTATDFSNVIEQVKAFAPHLVLLDIKLPGNSGFEICSQIRSFSDIPIVFVTSSNTDMDELNSIMLGGDAFITKPYNTAILLAKIASLLRRAYASGQSEILTWNGAALHLESSILEYNGKKADLTKNELKILYYLFKNAGKICPRSDIVDFLWDNDCDCLLYSNCFSRDFSIYRIESFNVADRDDCRNISAITNLLFHQYMDTL